MIILEAPYVSAEFCRYLEKTKIAVLNNPAAKQYSPGHDLNLVSEAEFIQGLNNGQRLYTTSENALVWVYANYKNQDQLDSIRLMKDKYAFRKVLKPMYTDYLFKEISADGLRHVNMQELKLPFILKPAIGFFSMGVYAVSTPGDWNKALDDIDANISSWHKTFPQTVLGDTSFIIEEYISGEEYAVDCYFDDAGKAVILNILKNNFSSDLDVGDRLYYTSKEIMNDKLDSFTSFLDQANTYIGAKNFPAHVELRVNGGRIVPIEFNPMRFAGWCTADIATHAYGINACDYYLNDRKPDWEARLTGKDGKIYSIIILNKPAPNHRATDLNQEQLCKHFSKTLELCVIERDDCPIFGFLFAETPSDKQQELDYIVKSDLTVFLK